MGNVIQFPAQRGAAGECSDAGRSANLPKVRPIAATHASGRKIGKQTPVHDRGWAWREARLRVEFFERLISLCHAASVLHEFHGDQDAARYQYLDHWKLMEKLDVARARLILTPVKDRGAFLEKQRLIKKSAWRTSLTQAQIAKALAVDETYLAIPKHKRAEALRKGKVLSIL